jgi:peroxiredoxin
MKQFSKKEIIIVCILACAVLAAVIIPSVMKNKENSTQGSTVYSADTTQYQTSTGYATTDKAVLADAPDITLTKLDGTSVKLSDLKGSPVFINIWTTWCPYCKEEMPDIESIYEKYKDQGLVVAAVSTDTASASEVKSFVEKNGYTFDVYYDPESSVPEALGLGSGIPQSVFITKDGKIAQTYGGMLDEDAMQSYIQQIL